MALLYGKYTQEEAEQFLKDAKRKYMLCFSVAFQLVVAVVVMFLLGGSWIWQLVLLVFAAGSFLSGWWFANLARLIRADMKEVFF